MRRLVRVLTIAAVVLSTELILADATAAAPEPRTALVLSISEGTELASNARTVQLLCEPTGGDHPKAQQACDALARVDGNFDALDIELICTPEYQPFTATADGLWRGRRVHYQQTYPNLCFLESHLSPVFDFF